MDRERAHAVVVGVLSRIAPELDPGSLDPGADLAVEYDLDSMDTLALMAGVAAEAGVDIDESDYPRLATIDGYVGYLVEATGGD